MRVKYSYLNIKKGKCTECQFAIALYREYIDSMSTTISSTCIISCNISRIRSQSFLCGIMQVKFDVSCSFIATVKGH